MLGNASPERPFVGPLGASTVQTLDGRGAWRCTADESASSLAVRAKGRVLSFERNEQGLLKRLDDPTEEPCTVGAVDEPVVVGERQR